MQEGLLGLIDLVYAAALDAERWQALLGDLTAALSAERGGRHADALSSAVAALHAFPGRTDGDIENERTSLGPLKAVDRRLLSALTPHLERALQLRRQLAAAEHRQRYLCDAFDRLAIAIAILDGRCRLIYANRAADTVFGKRDGLSVLDGTLVAAGRGARDRLLQLVAAAADGRSGGALAVPQPARGDRLQCLVTPLPGGSAELGDRARRLVALFVKEPAGRPASAATVMMSLYGLTAAEARIAGLLVGGRPLRAIADELDISYNTARTHLQHVFDKVGVNRQVELCRLIGLLEAAAGERGP